MPVLNCLHEKENLSLAPSGPIFHIFRQAHLAGDSFEFGVVTLNGSPPVPD
jgi:hypothetical protein